MSIKAAIILARLDSRRFPGKALRTLAEMPIIEHVLRRLNAMQVFDHVVLATTGRAVDDELAECFGALGGRVYRSPDEEIHDVAQRFVSAANSVGAEYALRANGDSPLIDHWLVTQGVNLLDTQPDLVTNLLPRTYPYGVSVELVRVATLESQLPMLDDAQREHVTACFYATPERFKIVSVPPCPWPPCAMRLTVDEPDDLDRLQRVLARLPCPLMEADMPSIISAAQSLEDEAK